jgi:hypothetical protein
VYGKGLGFDVAFRYPEEGDAALPIFAWTSQVSTFEPQKSFDRTGIFGIARRL